MFKVMIGEELFYFKNHSTLIDFLDDNLPFCDDSPVPSRRVVIERI